MKSKPDLLFEVMFKFNRIVFILLVQFFSFVFNIYYPQEIFSQTPPYYHYTSSEGLSSSTVYDMIQDRNGFMWFATVNGVSRFDGRKFRNYTSKEGLNSNSIVSLTEDSGGCIYFGNENKGYNIYNDGKIEKYSAHVLQNSVIKGMFIAGDKVYSYCTNNISKISPENIRNLFFLNIGSLPDSVGIYETVKLIGGTMLGATSKGLYHIEDPELTTINTIGILPDSTGINKMVNLCDGSILAATTRGLYKFDSQELKKINIIGLDTQEIFWLSSGKDNCITLGAKGKIFEIKDDYVVSSIDVKLNKKNNVTRILKDTKDNIWFSIVDKGLYFIKSGTKIIKDIGKKMGMENSLISNFIEDKEGNIWISTFGEGVFCLNNLYLNNYNYKDGLSNNNVLAIEKDLSDRIFIGTPEGLNVLDNDNIYNIHDKIGINKDYTYIYDIKCLNNLVYASGTFSNSKNITLVNYKNDQLYLSNTFTICISKDSSFINRYSSNNINILSHYPRSDAGENIYFFKNISDTHKILSTFEDNSKNLWIGSTTGLCKITNGQETFFYENEILNTTIKDITEDGNNNVWFAGNRGIASYRLKDSLITNYPKIHGYDISNASTLAVDKYNRLWIGSMNGLFILREDDKDSFNILNIETGLPSNEVLSLFYDTAKNVMWIGSAKGLSSLDVSEFDNEKILPVDVLIKKISTPDSVYTKFLDVKLKPKQNNLHLELTTTRYSSPATVKYQYKFENDWIDISDDYVNFSSLEKGDYRLEIRGKVINNPWGKPTLVTFTVLPKFLESQSIRVGLVILIILGFLYGGSKRIQYIKARNDEKLILNNQVNDLKHKALSSMMNPHFIFNSLNSVQYLINIDRKREANDYISLMARLIRMNLETASESYIKLDEEIRRLDLYLQIEKLRFSDKFNYEITAGPGVNSELIMIPNMIIQPFVENSIWHGIMPSGRDGNIKLSFKFEDVTVDDKTFRFFTIRITDNGIGLTEAQRNRKDGHVSQGIQIIQERLILLSKERKMPEPIFEDLNLKNKDSQGTEVVLSIPPEMYRIISN